MTIEDVLNTSHISVSTSTLKVVVNDLGKYGVLFHPRCYFTDDDVYEECPYWKKDMNYPSFVLDVSPWFEDRTLSIFVEHPYDLIELSNWLKTFE